MINIEEDQVYRFETSENRISKTYQLKNRNNASRRLWRYVRDNLFLFFGVARDYTAVFQLKQIFVAVHHFINEKPDDRMIDHDLKVDWEHILTSHASLLALFQQLEGEGYRITISEQAFTDAFLNDMFGEWNWHLQSPKNILGIWARRGDTSFLIELFFNQDVAPYGFDEAQHWPNLEETMESTQILLWEDTMPVDVINKKVHVPIGEEFAIAECVTEDIERETDEAIHRVFTENDVIIVSFSGGKDSNVVVQKCIRYKLDHPECKTKLIILSADTGSVDNPLMRDHIRKIKQAMADTLPIDIPFIIVEPEIEDAYFVCVLGSGYTPPSQMNKWCVSRLKIDNSRQALRE